MGSLIGGLYGAEQAKPYEEQSAQAIEEALQTIRDINLPSIEDQKIALEKLASVGDLTPEMVETILAGPSAMEGVSTDPRLAKAQLNALESLSKQGEEGLTAMDRAALNQLRGDVSREAQGREQSILQSMAARGMSGSGAELAARLGSSQSATQRASEEADRLAAMAQQRALESRVQSGQLGGQIRSQEFGEKSQIAQAKDAIDKFNAANRQNVAMTNVGAKNLAKAQNLANRQNIANQNIGVANQQQMFNKGLLGQQYERELGKAGALGTALGNVSTLKDKQAQQEYEKYYGMGAGVDKLIGTGAVAVAAGIASDKNVKKEIKSGEQAIEKLLSKLESYEFSYKDESKHGEGKRLGVMAQDMEKSSLGKDMVKEDEEGVKKIDAEKAISVLLSAASNIHKRIKKLEDKKNG